MPNPAPIGHDTAAELAANVTALLADITRADLNLDEVLRMVCEHAQRVTRADGCVVEMAEGDEMVYRAASGFLAKSIGTRMPRQTSLSGFTMDSGAIQTCPDSDTDPRVDREACARVGCRSMVVVPLRHGDMTVGVLKSAWREPHAFSEDIVRSLGLLAGIVAIAVRRAEEQDARAEIRRSLQASEARWRSVVEQSLAGIFVLEADRFVYANERFLEICGYTLEELRALPSALDLLTPVDREVAANKIRADLAGQIENSGHELRGRRRDGSEVVVQVFGSVVDAPGTPNVIGTVIDVTERHRTDSLLRSSEEWFRNLIEEASDMIGVSSTDGVYSYVSPSVRDQLGYEPSQLVGQNAFEFLHPDDVGRVQQEFAGMVANPPHRLETRLRFRHATLGWRDCDVRLRLSEADGKPVVIINSSDVTERAALQRQVVDAERLASLGRVASSMAHEFNNVLMGIQPFADLIARTRDAARLEKAASGIQSAVRRGRTITQQVLRFTRGEKPDRRNTPVERVLDMLRKELVPVLPADVHLEMSLDPSDLRILADGDQIEQLLMNLAVNARDAMARGGGTLTIAARPAGDVQYPFGVLPRDTGGFVHISVTDTGAGIPPELLTRIFEPLFTTKKAQGGSGLGLTISQQIATAHQGAIFVQSEVGSGSSFHVFLPAASAVSLPIEVAPAAYPTGLERVLIVEDDDLVADAMMTALASVHIVVHRVASGSAAADAVESFQPGLVVLDYGLPDMSGAAVYQLLRERWKDLPIVFATGHADAARLREEVGDSALQVCLKPFEITRLLGAMTNALGAQA